MTIKFLWSKLLRKARGRTISGSHTHPTSKVESGSHVVDCYFGKYSFCGYDREIYSCDIGSFCSIANRVNIGSGMHPMGWVSMSPIFYGGRDSVKKKFSTHKRDAVLRFRIGHDVWIGDSAMFNQGVSVGTGAAIGIGSLVAGGVASYAFLAGSPAKTVRMRCDQDTVTRLLPSEWWVYPDDMLAAYAKYFSKPKEFLAKIDR